MAIEPLEDAANGQRGPTDHLIREQIINAANAHFKHYGYSKTTVSDLAKAIGFSKAYIYKFFDSKQAIGQAICASCLQEISLAIVVSTAGARNSADKLRRFFTAIVETSTDLFIKERKLHDIAEVSSLERWPSSLEYYATTEEMLRQILIEGRNAGEFERKTPLDEVTRAVMQAMQPFIHPVMLRENLDRLPQGPNDVVSLILRSLSP
jgi:AcrR family transcriptional regulator